MRVDGDQADRALAFERAEPLDDARGWKAETRRARRFDGDKVAVFCVRGRARRDRKLLAEHFLFDRLQPAAAVLDLPENAEHALLGVIDDLDDAATMADAVVVLGFFDAQQDAVANAGGISGPRLARHMYADFRRGAVGRLIPFVRRGDEVAVAVARGDVGEHGRRQCAGMMQLLASLFDRAFVGEIAQHALELGTHGILQPEGASDFAGADFAGVVADEGENVSLGGK